jgi:hypothetical protein
MQHAQLGRGDTVSSATFGVGQPLLEQGPERARQEGEAADAHTVRQPTTGGARDALRTYASPVPQSMQKLCRERRIFAWESAMHFRATIFPFTISPQLGQQRTVTTMRP